MLLSVTLVEIQKTPLKSMDWVQIYIGVTEYSTLPKQHLQKERVWSLWLTATYSVHIFQNIFIKWFHNKVLALDISIHLTLNSSFVILSVYSRSSKVLVLLSGWTDEWSCTIHTHVTTLSTLKMLLGYSLKHWILLLNVTHFHKSTFYSTAFLQLVPVLHCPGIL